jgi:N-acetylglucosaminyl-diphospho-decaprenol L-rhamnosyltransferase
LSPCAGPPSVARVSPFVDVVVVSYNSRERLRACVEPLVHLADVHVVVADNASADGSLEAVGDLPVTALALPENGGFAHGCNAGWRAGRAPFVLFLNPDARVDEASLRRLVRSLEDDPRAGAAAPRIVDFDGTLAFSQRRFPQLRSTYAQALFLHRLFPRRRWVDELVREEDAYAQAGSPDWVSGACVLVRRLALEQLGGLDDGFFMYCEDIDLCRRLRDAGWSVRFEPGAVVHHEGGASAPSASLLPVLAASRVRYARKHRSRPAAALERLGIALGALTHMLVARGGRPARAAHARSFLRAVRDA